MKFKYCVITKIDPNGCEYDDIAAKDKEGRWSIKELERNPMKTGDQRKFLEIRMPAFVLGEVVILDKEYGREVCGRQRKPSKWFIETEMFNSLEKAVKRSQEVLKESYK